MEAGVERQTLGMLKTAFRFLLLRFLPGRLVPLLTVIEVVRLVRRLWKGRSMPVATPPRRLRTVGDRPGRNPIGPAEAIEPDVSLPRS